MKNQVKKFKNATIISWENDGLVSESNLKPEPLPKYPKGGLIPPSPENMDCPGIIKNIEKAEKIHSLFSVYMDLSKEKESIRESLRECNTRIQETKSKINSIINNS